ALIAGVSGIIGRHMAEELLQQGGWEVSGISRHANNLPKGVQHVAADLLDARGLRAALAPFQASHVFITTWSRQATEAENCTVNGAMIENLMSAVDGKKVRHVALATGLKHYMGPFEAYAKNKPITPFREEQPRLDYPNFYYVQEDAVFAAAKRQGFTWSVHRPHTLIGYAVGNAMNMASTLAAYATICRETGIPFVFPGSPSQYAGVVDITDGRIMAKHMAWAATSPKGADQAFNIVNGEVFRWNWMWPKLAAYFGLKPGDYPGHAQPLERMMKDTAPIWQKIGAKHGLKDVPIDQLASWWHTDLDLGRELETFAAMTKSRDLGFLAYQNSVKSFTDAFDRLRQDRDSP
ncbi:MAG: SDR family oxidoreductase, partial [Rhizobiales bacterium]|nr:SDR family oxidoreductase [Hyphomicrobiales bacterium]